MILSNSLLKLHRLINALVMTVMIMQNQTLMFAMEKVEKIKRAPTIDAIGMKPK